MKTQVDLNIFNINKALALTTLYDPRVSIRYPIEQYYYATTEQILFGFHKSSVYRKFLTFIPFILAIKIPHSKSISKTVNPEHQKQLVSRFDVIILHWVKFNEPQSVLGSSLFLKKCFWWMSRHCHGKLVYLSVFVFFSLNLNDLMIQKN